MAPADGHGKAGFLSRLKAGLERCELAPRARLLVAISGGADSTALLLGLRELAASGSDFEIEAAHFNHQLRADRSDADEQFCHDLCDRLGIRFHSGTGNVSERAAKTGDSIEAAARDLRYRFLTDTVAEHGFDGVATGHTMDDQAETVLLAVTRGSGLRGLSGMAHVTERSDLSLRVLRPMLEMRRSDTEEFCALNSVTPVSDQSNADPSHARNRIRHNVLPELAKINPGVVGAINRLAQISSSDTALIDSIAGRLLDHATVDEFGGLSRKTLVNMQPALQVHVIAEAFRRAVPGAQDLGSAALLAAVEAVNSGTTGSIDLPHGAQVVIEHDTVRLLLNDDDTGCPYPASVGEHLLSVPGEIKFDGGIVLKAKKMEGGPPTRDVWTLTRWQALISPDALSKSELKVCSRRDGDRFHPLGMPGEMKLQDFFVNQHVPARWRDRVPLVVGKHGICWVAGERVAEWAKVDEKMREVVLLDYSQTDIEPLAP